MNKNRMIITILIFDDFFVEIFLWAKVFIKTNDIFLKNKDIGSRWVYENKK